MNFWLMLGLAIFALSLVVSWIPWMMQEWKHDRQRSVETHDWILHEHEESLKAAAMAPLYRGGVRGNHKG